MTTSSDVRIFFCTTPTNLHYSFDGLMGQASTGPKRNGKKALWPARVRTAWSELAT